jgi:triosephosphate isomerase
MYKTAAETRAFFEKFSPLVAASGHCEILVCPPYLSVDAAVEAARGTRVQVGAQNLYWKKEGAFTGEVSAPMIRAAGCTHVLVGHSERRQFFGETDESVSAKAAAALDAGLAPVVCVGERVEERQSGNTDAVLKEQFQKGIGPLSEEQFSRILIAYEPVWAIGTGLVATPDQAADAHRTIREEARARYGAAAADQVRILYGGSVKPDNIKGLMARTGIDGALVGGASLDPFAFASIVNF